METPIDTGAITALEAFLKYGPIGLAGLMLILVIIALSFGTLNAIKARLLRTFLYVGALCFMAALAAEFFTPAGQFDLRVTVAPQDLGSQSAFPPPLIRINGQRVDRNEAVPFKIAANTSILIDVTDALGRFEVAEKKVEAQQVALTEAQVQAKEIATQLEAITTSNSPAASLPVIRNLSGDVNRSIIQLDRALRLP